MLSEKVFELSDLPTPLRGDFEEITIPTFLPRSRRGVPTTPNFLQNQPQITEDSKNIPMPSILHPINLQAIPTSKLEYARGTLILNAHKFIDAFRLEPQQFDSKFDLSKGIWKTENEVGDIEEEAKKSQTVTTHTEPLKVFHSGPFRRSRIFASFAMDKIKALKREKLEATKYNFKQFNRSLDTSWAFSFASLPCSLLFALTIAKGSGADKSDYIPTPNTNPVLAAYTPDFQQQLATTLPQEMGTGMPLVSFQGSVGRTILEILGETTKGAFNTLSTPPSAKINQLTNTNQPEVVEQKSPSQDDLTMLLKNKTQESSITKDAEVAPSPTTKASTSSNVITSSPEPVRTPLVQVANSKPYQSAPATPTTTEPPIQTVKPESYETQPNFKPFWVQNFKETQLWSGPDSKAVSYGTIGQWRYMQAVKAIGPRLMIKLTNGDYAYIDRSAVGPSGEPKPQETAQPTQPSQQDIRTLIQARFAERFSPRVAGEALIIGNCESGFNPKKVNYNDAKITGFNSLGLFQENGPEFVGWDDPERNIQKAMDLYQSRGWQPWYNCATRNGLQLSPHR